MFLCPPARGPGEACKLPQWGRVRGGDLAILNFFRLTEPLLVSILLMLHLFQWNFRGVRAIRPHNQIFVGVRTPKGSATMLTLQSCYGFHQKCQFLWWIIIL